MLRLSFLTGAVLVVVTAATAAFAAPPPHAGPPNQKPKNKVSMFQGAHEGCRPKVALILKGTLTRVTDTELTLNVRRTNRHGAPYRSAVPITIKTAGAKVTLGRKDSLSPNDPVLIKARVCRSELTNKPMLTAKRVVLLGRGLYRR